MKGIEQNRRRELYLRFSEDQFEIARLGLVDVQTWAVWHEGIRGEVTETDVTRFEPWELVFLRRCLHSAEGHKAWACEAFIGNQRRRRVAWWLDRRLFGTPSFLPAARPHTRD